MIKEVSYTTNKNIDYYTHPGASIFNFKNNYNNFISDFSNSNFENLVKNSDLKIFDDNGNAAFWNYDGSHREAYDPSFLWTRITFSGNGNFNQVLKNLKSNTNYTVIFYGYSETNNLKNLSISVSAIGNDPLIYLSDTDDNNSYTEIFSYINPYNLISESEPTSYKRILKFKTRTYIKENPNNINLIDKYILQIKNRTSDINDLYFQKICVFEGDIEINDISTNKFNEYTNFNTNTQKWEITSNGTNYNPILIETEINKHLLSVIRPNDFSWDTSSEFCPSLQTNNYSQFILQTLNITNKATSPQIYFNISPKETQFYKQNLSSEIIIDINFILESGDFISYTEPSNIYTFECSLMSIENNGILGINNYIMSTSIEDDYLHSKYISGSSILPVYTNGPRLFKQTLTLNSGEKLVKNNQWVGFIKILTPYNTYNWSTSDVIVTAKILNVSIYSKDLE